MAGIMNDFAGTCPEAAIPDKAVEYNLKLQSLEPEAI